MDGDESDVRGLTPIWYAVLSLPGGVAGGFVAVSLSYILRRNGVSVEAIAGLVSLGLLPQTWRFLIGPAVDVSLSSKRWYLICIAAEVVCFVVLAFTPLNVAGMPLLGAVALALGVATAAGGCAIAAAMARTTPDARRGEVAGWTQTGSLGGAGLGGGAGLWLAVHAGGPSVAALVLTGVCIVCATPIL